MIPGARHNGAQPVVYDLGLLFPVLLLVGMGIVMVYSASSALALEKYGSDYFFLKKQATFSLIGMVVLVVFSYIPFRLYRILTYPVLIIAITLLAAVAFTHWGVVAGGSIRWLQMGPIRFQPSELARLALVVATIGLAGLCVWIIGWEEETGQSEDEDAPETRHRRADG